MSDFKLPDTYYDPPEILAWCQGCADCGWISDTIEQSHDDLKLVEKCPECNSENLYTEQDYFSL